MRKAFNFYKSYFDVAKELNDKDRLSFYDALITRQFTGIETELKGMANFAYISQKFNIDAQVVGYESKTKATLGGSVGGCQGGSVGGSVQEKEKEKGKEKEELTIDNRKLKFAESLKPFLEAYGKEMLNDFYLYWTEHGEDDKKFRQEKEKSFSVKQRLERWSKNNFNQPKQQKNEFEFRNESEMNPQELNQYAKELKEYRMKHIQNYG